MYYYYNLSVRFVETMTFMLGIIFNFAATNTICDDMAHHENIYGTCLEISTKN